LGAEEEVESLGTGTTGSSLTSEVDMTETPEAGSSPLSDVGSEDGSSIVRA
jgi:hypothetical protein